MKSSMLIFALVLIGAFDAYPTDFSYVLDGIVRGESRNKTNDPIYLLAETKVIAARKEHEIFQKK